MPAASELSLVEAAKASDRVYFTLAADSVPLPGCLLLTMPGLAHLDSATVFHDLTAAPEDPAAVIACIRREARARGLALIRLYLMERDPVWEAALKQAGFLAREEVILAASPETQAAWRGQRTLQIRPVVTEADWEIRGRLLASSGRVPDGHGNNLDAYLEMEQQKSSCGDLTFYLAHTADGKVVGSAGLMHLGAAARLKNLVVHAEVRRRGHGSAMIRSFVPLLEPHQSLVTYALQYPPALRLYSRLKFTRITSCYEWTSKGFSR